MDTVTPQSAPTPQPSPQPAATCDGTPLAGMTPSGAAAGTDPNAPNLGTGRRSEGRPAGARKLPNVNDHALDAAGLGKVRAQSFKAINEADFRHYANKVLDQVARDLDRGLMDGSARPAGTIKLAAPFKGEGRTDHVFLDDLDDEPTETRVFVPDMAHATPAAEHVTPRDIFDEFPPAKPSDETLARVLSAGGRVDALLAKAFQCLAAALAHVQEMERHAPPARAEFSDRSIRADAPQAPNARRAFQRAYAPTVHELREAAACIDDAGAILDQRLEASFLASAALEPSPDTSGDPASAPQEFPGASPVGGGAGPGGPGIPGVAGIPGGLRLTP
jgi:hypothetical protein